MSGQAAGFGVSGSVVVNVGAAWGVGVGEAVLLIEWEAGGFVHWRSKELFSMGGGIFSGNGTVVGDTGAGWWVGTSGAEGLIELEEVGLGQSDCGEPVGTGCGKAIGGDTGVIWGEGRNSCEAMVELGAPTPASAI